MAKTKADWLEEAKTLGLKLTTKDKIADIKAAIDEVKAPKHDKVADEKPVEEKVTVAKAGKRSAKALKEAEDEEARLEKAEQVKKGELTPEGDEAPAVKKGPVPVTRPRSERRSKGYRNVAKLIEAEKQYDLKEALELATKTSSIKFDATVEMHFRLGVDPRQADQNIRDTVSLPSGTGKTVKVAVIAPADLHDAAKKAGADIVKDEEMLEDFKNGEMNFDLLIATPDMMPKLAAHARVLGPKGLMPSPKSNTVTKEVAKAVEEAKKGKIEYRVDPQGIVHTGIGKVSFGADKLLENATTLLTSINSNKPSSLKGNYLLSVYVATTMGPSIRVNL